MCVILIENEFDSVELSEGSSDRLTVRECDMVGRRLPEFVTLAAVVNEKVPL